MASSRGVPVLVCGEFFKLSTRRSSAHRHIITANYYFLCFISRFNPDHCSDNSAVTMTKIIPGNSFTAKIQLDMQKCKIYQIKRRNGKVNYYTSTNIKVNSIEIISLMNPWIVFRVKSAKQIFSEIRMLEKYPLLNVYRLPSTH